jgi:dCTP deaminase
MSILSDRDIVRAVEEGTIRIDPFDPVMLNPASYDLTLGDQVAMYASRYLDSREEQIARRFTLPVSGVELTPGNGYLMHTVERVGSGHFVPVLDGKSSLGRLFVQVHATAGYGDPGYFGQWTLEVAVTHPVRLYPSMRIAQMRFHTLTSPVERKYQGNYQNERAAGPVPSQAFRQFTQRKEPE